MGLTAFGIALAGLVLAWLAGRRLVAACRRANLTDWGHPWLNLLDGLNRLYCVRFHGLNLHSRLRLPRSGPAIVVANHVSGLDPLLLIAASRRPLRFLIAREQYRRPGLHWLFRAVGCIPVDRERRPARALREALKRVREGEVVAVFPHGKIHLDSDPPHRLKPGAVYLALTTGAPLIPVRIDGVRGQGHVLPALFLPSNSYLSVLPVLQPQRMEGRELLSRLEGHLVRKE